MLAHVMLISPVKVLPFFHIKTYLSLTIILVPLTTAYDILSLKIDIPIITRMQAPRLLGVQFKAQDSDHHGHRTHTSVLSFFYTAKDFAYRFCSFTTRAHSPPFDD